MISVKDLNFDTGRFGPIHIFEGKDQNYTEAVPSSSRNVTYTFENNIAEGASKIVYLYKQSVHEISQSCILSFYKKDVHDILIQREISFLNFAKHPNIATPLYLFFCKSEQRLGFVFPFFSTETLFDLIQQQTKLNRIDLLLLQQQLIEGLMFLHKSQIIHRDIKPENLIVRDCHKSYFILIADFGSAMTLDEIRGEFSLEGRTIEYINPAHLLYKIGSSKIIKNIHLDSDIWQSGLTFFCLREKKIHFVSIISRLFSKQLTEINQTKDRDTLQLDEMCELLINIQELKWNSKKVRQKLKCMIQNELPKITNQEQIDDLKYVMTMIEGNFSLNTEKESPLEECLNNLFGGYDLSLIYERIIDELNTLRVSFV